jgi:Bacterial transcriptional activator domain
VRLALGKHSLLAIELGELVACHPLREWLRAAHMLALCRAGRQANGRPIVIDGLWGLRFGNGNAAKTNELLFSAGADDESNGLLGKIVANS